MKHFTSLASGNAAAVYARFLPRLAQDRLLRLHADIFPHARLTRPEHEKELSRIFRNKGLMQTAINLLHDRLELEASGEVRFPTVMDCVKLRAGIVDDLPRLRREQLENLKLWSAQAGIVIDSHNTYRALGHF